MVNFPGRSSRTVLVGSTGAGKSQLGVWLLSTRDRKTRPVFIFDPKRDKLIAECVDAAGGVEIRPGGRIPTKPGLYVIRTMPTQEDADALEKFMWGLWAQEDCCLYIDEGYMIPKNSAAFRALLTQGRSKNIEMITLSQRPVLLDRFVFSEGEFFGVMRLNDIRDRKTVCEMTGMTINYKLAPFNFVWYDGATDTQTIMSPVPDRETIIASFGKRRKRTTRGL